jgi:S1-C subfamily serine protease
VLGIRIRPADGAIFVEEVDAGFTGSVAGLQKGDKVIKLNDKEV